MLELHATVDLLGSINQFIFTHRKNSGVSTEHVIITPRIINQEKGGSIIFVWHDIDTEQQPPAYVTHFGIYEADSQKQHLLYTYEKKVKVVSCSVNQERTLLAFSIVKQRDPSSEKKNKEVYHAYLAQLQSVEKIVFSLNMERSTFIKVQFLYMTQQPGQGRDSYMLVFLHKESIGLYKVPMARIGDRGVMMSAQPKTEQIERKFVWCQWDAQHQRLHYIQNVRLDDRPDSNISQKLSTFQFYNQAKYENMIDVPINFPFPYIRTADKPHYGDIPLHPGIPDLSLNVSVLTQPNGTFCICYHKQATETKPSQTRKDTEDVEYYVSMVHHARTLYCCVSSLPRAIVVQKRLVFSWIGSYLAVLLPGHFVHLLNIGPNFEPSHHILCHDLKKDDKTPQNDCTMNLRADRLTTTGDSSSTDTSLATSGATIPKSLSSPSLSSLATIDTSAGSPAVTIATASSSSPSSALSSMLPPRLHIHPQSTTTTATSAPPSNNVVHSVFSEHCRQMKTLLPCQTFIRASGSVAQHLYDYRGGVLMKLVVTLDGVVDQFRHAYWQTRLAILHYLLLHNNDIFTIKKLFEVLCESMTNAEINNIFTEYLVASTYAEMKKQMDREVLNLLSFTSIQTLRGQFEKKPSGDRLAHISYLSMEIVDFNKKISKAHHKSQQQQQQQQRMMQSADDDFWSMLIQRTKHHRSSDVAAKFTHEAVMRVYRMAELEEAQGKSLWDPMHMENSFFDGIYTLKLTEMPSSLRRSKQGKVKDDQPPMRASPSPSPSSSTPPSRSSSSSGGGSGGRKSKMETVFGPAPIFLQNQVSQESTVFKRRLSVLTEELLIKHLLKHLKKESRSKAKNVAKAFLFCQAKVSQQLCHLIWSLRGHCLSRDLENSFLPNLKDEGTDEEYELFQLYERYYLVAGDLGYPFPPGFSSFFTSLGFKCLDLHLFLQYVDNHVLVLTPDFILQLLEDLDDDQDDPDVTQVKFQIISRLPKAFAEECFERWNHPMVQQRRARQQVARILVQNPKSHVGLPSSKSVVSLSSERTDFQPLNVLLKQLDHQVSQLPSSRPVQYDSSLVEEMSLYHSNTTLSFPLSSQDF